MGLPGSAANLNMANCLSSVLFQLQLVYVELLSELLLKAKAINLSW